MKVQYLGDKNDYRKFSLLRLLAREGAFRIGVCWMLTEDDGGKDGGLRSFLDEPALGEDFDPELFALLKTVPSRPSLPDLQRVEREGVVPEARYFEELTPRGRDERAAFHARCMQAFVGADLVFFDPDNGLEVRSCPKGCKKSNKYVYYDEIREHYVAGRSALTYQHYPRKPREQFRQETADRLAEVLPRAEVWSFATPHVVFLLTVRPEHQAKSRTAAAAVNRSWPPSFMWAERRDHAGGDGRKGSPARHDGNPG